MALTRSIIAGLRACLGGVVAAALCGCDAKIIENRAKTIREQNAKLDHVSKMETMREVRKRWAVRGKAWFGKLPDGSLLRLDAPVVTIEPVKEGRPFCCNWLGEVTLAADCWKSLPASNNRELYVMKYRAIMEGAGQYNLTAITGSDVVPPTDEEIATIEKSVEQ